MAQAPATPNPNPTNQTRQSRIQPQQTNPSKSEFKSKPDNPAHPHKPSKPIPASQTRRPSPNNPRFKPKQTRPHSRPKPGTPRSEPKPKPGRHESEPKPKADGPRSYIFQSANLKTQQPRPNPHGNRPIQNRHAPRSNQRAERHNRRRRSAKSCHDNGVFSATGHPDFLARIIATLIASAPLCASSDKSSCVTETIVHPILSS